MGLELAWGSVRRTLLKRFFPRYVQRMAALRRGERNPCPFDVVDPRDLKFHRDPAGYFWNPADDPFAWRERLPIARVGLAEVCLLSPLFLTASAIGAWGATHSSGWIHALCQILTGSALVGATLNLWFFRNPRRTPPDDPAAILAPADGTVVQIAELVHDEFIAGPALQIGIFLSVFDVHINRVPAAARIIGLSYRPGKFLNALRPASARENQRLSIRLELDFAPFRRLVVHQIAGAIARRIVCWARPGETFPAGAPLGMIKFGSRTELILPREEGLVLLARPGQRVRAGETVLARWH